MTSRTSIALVALLLLLQGCSDSIPVHVIGDRALAGAKLYVNGKVAGELSSPSGGDLVDASILVPRRSSLIEVRKEGYASAVKTLTFKSSEGYMSVKVSNDHRIFITDDGTTERSSE